MIEREDARENKKKTIDISITKTNTFFSHHHIDSDGVMNRIYRNKKKKKKITLTTSIIIMNGGADTRQTRLCLSCNFVF